MKRVFFSFHVPTGKAGQIIEGLERKNLPLVLYPPENLHITLKFIGEVNDEQLASVIKIGQEAAKEASTRKIDFIPNRFSLEGGRLRIGIKINDDLVHLFQNITDKLLALKIGKIDNRPYSPHITIGRPEERFELQSLNMFEVERYLFPLEYFGLYESQPGSQNLGEYSLLKDFPLQK